MERVPWIGGAGHATAARLRRADPGAWSRAFTFGFVRHPLDRLVSAYLHYAQRPLPPNLDLEHPRAWALYIVKMHAAAVRSGYEALGFRQFLHRFDLAWFAMNTNHFRPQVDFLQDAGVTIVDFVGRYERLQLDWAQVCQAAVQPVLALPAINSGKRESSWATYYADDVRALDVARRVYAADFVAWGYE